MASESGDPYIGSTITLISKYEIRYEGILYVLSVQDSTIGLRNGTLAFHSLHFSFLLGRNRIAFHGFNRSTFGFRIRFFDEISSNLLHLIRLLGSSFCNVKFVLLRGFSVCLQVLEDLILSVWIGKESCMRYTEESL